MMRGAAVATLVVCAAVLGLAALAGADPPTGTVTPYAIPTGATGATGVTGPAGAVEGIAADSDGNLWFTDAIPAAADAGFVGSITTAGPIIGTITEPSGATGLAGPDTIAPGAPGTMWFTEPRRDGAVDELNVSTGTVTTSPGLPQDFHDPGGVAVDAQGNVWATVTGDSSFIAELAPPYNEDTWKQFDLGSVDVDPGSIVLGPDGNMWFTEVGADKIGTITTGASPTVTVYPSSGALPPGALGNIIRGPDGYLWVGVAPVNQVNAGLVFDGSLRAGVAAAALVEKPALLRITPAGVVTPFFLPTGSNPGATANPDVLASGPDRRLWMPDVPGTDGGLTAFTTNTTGTFTTYAHLLSASDTITSIIADPGKTDSLWLTDQTANTVDNVQLTPPTITPPPTTTTSTTTSSSTAAPPALTAVLTPVSAVTTAGSTLSGTISEAAGSPATAVSYDFEYGTSTAYGSSTPPLTASLTPTGMTVSATLTGLTPYTTYHYRLVVSDCSASSCQAVSGDQTFTTGSMLQPQANTTVGATTTAGSVLIELPGKHHFIHLSAGELIPLGATINTLHGTVLIQSATGPGELASGLFSGGLFTVTQRPGTTVTVLTLASAFKACVAKPLAHAAAAAALKKPKKRKKSKKVVNQVFGNAHGQFSTRGHYATAADEGTKWHTEDRCDGTLIVVTVGRVTVTDRVRHRTFVLTAGHHYLAGAR
jgi:streptogramin lyase